MKLWRQKVIRFAIAEEMIIRTKTHSYLNNRAKGKCIKSRLPCRMFWFQFQKNPLTQRWYTEKRCFLCACHLTKRLSCCWCFVSALGSFFYLTDAESIGFNEKMDIRRFQVFKVICCCYFSETKLEGKKRKRWSSNLWRLPRSRSQQNHRYIVWESM
jgi:hypothetical protein